MLHHLSPSLLCFIDKPDAFLDGTWRVIQAACMNASGQHRRWGRGYADRRLGHQILTDRVVSDAFVMPNDDEFDSVEVVSEEWHKSTEFWGGPYDEITKVIRIDEGPKSESIIHAKRLWTFLNDGHLMNQFPFAMRMNALASLVVPYL